MGAFIPYFPMVDVIKGYHDFLKNNFMFKRLSAK